MKIFVYGTLKRTGCRRSVLRDQEFLGEASTQAAYRMFSLGDYPGLVDAAQLVGSDHQPGFRIHGELYEVDGDCKRKLDAIECVDEGLYQLRSIDLVAPFDSEEVFAYFYLLSVEGCPECGDCW